MWGKEDANQRLGWLKGLLREVDRMWRDRVLLLLLTEKCQGFVPLRSRLYEFLFRETRGRSVSLYGDIDEFMAQQRCILILVSIMCGIYNELSEDGGIKVVSRAVKLSAAMRTRLSSRVCWSSMIWVQIKLSRIFYR